MLDPMHRQASACGARIGFDGWHVGGEHADAGMVWNRSRRPAGSVGRSPTPVDAVDEQVQRRRFDAQVPVRRDVFEQLHGAASKLPGREDFRRDGRQRKVGGEHRHLQQHTGTRAHGCRSAPGRRGEQVLAAQMPQPQAAIRRMQQ